MSRKVTIYNTIGDNAKEIFSSADNWGGLQQDMTRNSISFRDMKAVVGESQVTLESSEALLPDGEFSLFLMAGKVKSGSDEDLIDTEEGIEWDEVDWNNEENHVEEYSFSSAKDLMIARAKKASYYLDKVVQFVISSRTSSSTTTTMSTKDNALLNSLRAEAAKLQSNLNIFG